jgi:multidrug resistance protein MdtO
VATVAVPAARSRTFAWLRALVRDELAPYPGRGAVVSRMVLSASIVMLINMTFQIPYGAYAANYGLTISRENADATLRDVRTSVLGFLAGAAYVLLGSILFASDTFLRVPWVLVSFFLMFWLLSALANYRAAARFGYLVAITIPLWDEIVGAEQKVTGTLWAIGSLSLAYFVTAALEIIFLRFQRGNNMTNALADRLTTTAAYLRSMSAGAADAALEQRLIRLTSLGTSRMRRDLIRSDYPAEMAQQMGAVVALVGRLVDLAANLRHFQAQISHGDPQRLSALADKIEVLADRLHYRRGAEKLNFSADLSRDDPATIPLVLELETAISLIDEALRGSEYLDRYEPRPETAAPRKPFFAPDAFTNVKHVHFAIRGALAAGVCYLTYNLIAWPGISTAVTTCFLTALTTVGASRQKQFLRFSGAIVGGVILGFGAQIFILPEIDSISGFLVLFLAVTIPAAWIAASGPRLSYFGVQITLGFYLINLQEFKFQTSLAIARDRVAGIVVGLLAMWLIFDRLWERSALAEMRHTFVSSFGLLSTLMREPVSSDQRAGLEKTYSLRESINTNFDKLRQDADGVMMEFGSDRERHLAERAQLLRWQLQLRIIFITRIALLKYRLRVRGFELPEPVLKAQQTFDNGLADRLEAIADRLQSNDPGSPLKNESGLMALENAVQNSYPADPHSPLATSLQTFLHLSRRIESLLGAIEQEVVTNSQRV